MASSSYLLVTRAERHIIKRTNKLYTIFDDLCFKAKNLYNFANYIQRQSFLSGDGIYDFKGLNVKSRDREDNQDYRALPAQTSNQVIKTLSEAWVSFFKANRKYLISPEGFTGKPKIPGYLSKSGRQIAILTNQQCKLEAGYLTFPKHFNGLKLKTKVTVNFQQLRVTPRGNTIILEVLYLKDYIEPKPKDNDFISLDLGLDNFATIANSKENSIPVVINGKGLKSYNKRYNKLLSHYRSIAKRMNNLNYTNRMRQLGNKRNNYMDNFIHQASKYVVDYAENPGITTIIIGNNKDWKRNSKLSTKVNQSFIQIPHQRFIEMVTYKAQDRGITVYLPEESYTSGTSFIDNELPTKENYNKSIRIHRGLFKSNKGITINADLNAAYQIAKKVFPNIHLDGIEGVGLHPVRVNVI